MLYGNILCGDTNPSNSVNHPSFSQSNPNEPNPKLAGLSKNGIYIEKKLKKDVKKGEIEPQEVGLHRVAHLHRDMASAQGIRNSFKAKELETKEYLNNRGRGDLTSLKSRVRSKWYKSSEYRYNKSLNTKEKYKKKIRNIVSDVAIHQQHGNIHENDVPRITKSRWSDSLALGYHHDARITSEPGYQSRNSSPPPSISARNYHFLTSSPPQSAHSIRQNAPSGRSNTSSSSPDH